MARAGRNRKTGKREPNGRVVRQTLDEGRRTVWEQRAKHLGLTIEQAKDARAEHAAGLALLKEQIDGDQYDASQRYLKVRAGYCLIHGVPSPLARSASLMDEIRGGMGGDLDEEWVSRISRQWQDCYIAMEATGRGTARNVEYLVVHEAHMCGMSKIQADIIRRGLNALVDYFGLRTDRVDRRAG